MELLLDTANVEAIRKYTEYYPITGITTNPSILCAEKREFYEVYDEIREITGANMQLHVQVTAHDCEGMLKEADTITERLGKEVYIKVPAVEEGIKAMKLLKKRGNYVTATAILTPQQALLAGMAGADYVAPYINRMCSLNIDPIETVRRIRTLFDNQKLETKIVGASFRNVQQIIKCYEAGAEAVTVKPDFLTEMTTNGVVDRWIEKFDEDWIGLYGDKRIYELDR